MSSGDKTTMLDNDVWSEDPDIFNLLKKEKQRQKEGLEMIASENITSVAVLQSLGSCLHNKYSEGLPGLRYYGGNEYIDEVELLCQKRALEAYGLDESKWGVNVQPYSGSPANFAVYTALVEPHGRIMGLDLPDGGHLTHGFFTPTKKVSATSIFFESMPYKVDPKTGLIDYDKLRETAKLFRPKIIIAGMSCYARKLDYGLFRSICDEVGALLMADISHVSGLVATGEAPSPFQHSDIVTTTTHKMLRGPRAAVIFFRRGVRSVDANGVKTEWNLESKINQAVFPGLQGGPHNNTIAAMAVAFKQSTKPEFKQYCRQVIVNAQRLSDGLKSKGYDIATGGTDCHLVLVDLRPIGINGAKAERALEEVGIVCNKNTTPGDKSALNPSGIRLGTPALTTRGFKEADIDKTVDLLHKTLLLAKEVQNVSGPKLVDFKKVLTTDKGFQEKFNAIKKEVSSFASQFHLPGLPEY